MKKRIYSLLCLFLMLTQQVLPLNIVKQYDEGWFDGGYDLVKGVVGGSLLSALFIKAQENEMQKSVAEQAIRFLNEDLKNTDLTEEKRVVIKEKIKEQELIRDRKKTLGQKAAQVALGLMGTAFVGGIMYTLWDPYLVKTNRLLDKYCGSNCSVSVGNFKILEIQRVNTLFHP